MIYTCYYCNTRLPGKQIKRCSRCLLVTYCSKECQTASWKASHKNSCVVHPSLSAPYDPNKVISESDMPKPYTPEWLEIQVDKKLSRWLQLWRSSFQMFATFCLDLANHPPDRVLTHCMKLIVQPRNLEDDDAKQYEVIDASVVRFSDIQAANPNLKAHIDPTDLTRLRFVVIMQNNRGEPRRLRLFQWNDRSTESYRNMDKEDSAAIGGPNSGWSRTLIACVQTDTPAEVEKMFGQGKESTS
ncbi:hypothetical protein CVT25_008106 [Psilocybe cyanescens]|uniref:MYND-type domain-containing protein n=1 Tax=Psilocybe cyanescens TaxID=93625 RepID=A0A409X9K8_PSICY|nr:hypothetical protein CVT25_008106 [Psilocybe cyanescens]